MRLGPVGRRPVAARGRPPAPAAAGRARSARRRRTAGRGRPPVARCTGSSRAARSARGCRCRGSRARAGRRRRRPSSPAARPRRAGSPLPRRCWPGGGAARASSAGRCPARGPGRGRCGPGTAWPGCRTARRSPAAHGWAASRRRSRRGSSSCRRRCGRPARPWPNWPRRPCCGARPPSSGGSPRLRRAAPGRASGAAPARRRRLRRWGRDRESRAVSSWAASCPQPGAVPRQPGLSHCRMARPRLHGADLRGAARLATDATAGLTDLVEAMHARIARVPGLGRTALDGRTERHHRPGLQDHPRRHARGRRQRRRPARRCWRRRCRPPPTATHRARSAKRSSRRSTACSATTWSPAPTRWRSPMAFRRDGKPLTLDARGARAAPARRRAAPAGAAARPVHERPAVAARRATTTARRWRANCGYTPVYLHYNSGLHVSINGHALARQLERTARGAGRCRSSAWCCSATAWAACSRAARCTTARRPAMRWPARARRPGVPGHAAPRRAARARRPLGRPAARRHALRRAVRAPGQAAQRRHHRPAPRQPGRRRLGRPRPLRARAPTGASTCRCPTACAATRWPPPPAQQSGDLKDRLLGDGLVPLDSALGRHKDPARCLAFAEHRQWIGYGMNHLDLLGHGEVIAQLQRWLQ